MPCACRRANGSPCPSPCTSPSWKKRSSRPRRWASATFKRFPWRSVPSRTPSSGAWERRHWVRRPRSHPQSRFLRTPDSVNSRSAGSAPTSLYAGSDPSSAMYLDGVYLARPAMAFVQFLDLDRIEVLRGPQGTLYGRNAVGGAMNLISKPPTNDFQASASLTAGNFGALRGDARVSGPLKRDRVMGSARVRAGRPRRLRPRPRASGPSAWRRRCHRGAGPAARGLRSPDESAAVERRRPPGRDSTDLQQGAGGEAGISGRQPARSSRRSSIGARLESHAALRRERASDDGTHAIHHPGQPDSVSNAGLRILRGCRHHRTRPGDDAPARAAASAVGGDHDLAPAAQADVGRWCLSLRRIRSPDVLGRSAGSSESRFGSTRASTRPAARSSDRRPSD